MTPRKQVPNLKDLSIKSVGKFLECVSLELMAIVCEFCKRDPNLGYSFLKASISHLSNHLFDHLPCGLVDSVVKCVLQLLPRLIIELKESYVKCVWVDTFMIKMRTLILLTNILLHEKVQSIDVSRIPRAMKHVIMSDLHKLSGLKHLDLGAGSCGWEISETEQLILRGLTCMPQLVELHLAIDCTDALIKCISSHCKQLQVLVIPHSRSVTQRSIPYLIQLDNLKHLCITHTSITNEGYIELLVQLRGLTNMGMCNYISTVMPDIKEKQMILKLTNLECGKIDVETLEIIVQCCPGIVSLTLHDVRETEIHCLIHLKHLKSLTLVYGNIDRMKLFPYLDSNPNLDSLYLKGIHLLDELTLMKISDSCPSLSSLTISDCQFVATRSMTALSNMKYNKYFTRLEKVRLYTRCETEHLDIILKHCPNIVSISFGNSTVPNDAYIERMLRYNSMNKLMKLKISHCHTLSMKSVETLIKCCPNLSVLCDLRSWYLISNSECNKLVEQIERDNLDLNISLVSQ